MDLDNNSLEETKVEQEDQEYWKNVLGEATINTVLEKMVCLHSLHIVLQSAYFTYFSYFEFIRIYFRRLRLEKLVK